MHFARSLRSDTPAFAWLALSLGLSTGCGGSPWTVAQRASPNPFTHAPHAFAIAPTSFESVHVGPHTEAVYLAGKTPADQDAWEAAKRALSAHVVTTTSAAREGITILPLESAPAEVVHIIRPTVTMVEPGSGTKADAVPCEVQMTVQITTRNGEVLDTFSIGTGLATTEGSTVSQRLQRAGDNLGGLIVRYVRDRTGS